MKLKHISTFSILITTLIFSWSCSKFKYLEPEKSALHNDTNYVYNRLSKTKSYNSSKNDTVVTNYIYNKNNEIDSIITSTYKDSVLTEIKVKKYTFENGQIIAFEDLILYPSYSKQVTNYILNIENKITKISINGEDQTFYYYSPNGKLDYILFSKYSDSTDVEQTDTSINFTSYSAEWIRLKKMAAAGDTTTDIDFPPLRSINYIKDNSSINGYSIISTSACGGCGNGNSSNLSISGYANHKLPYPLDLNISPILEKKWLPKDYFPKSEGSGAFSIKYDYETDKYGRVIKKIGNSYYRGQKSSDTGYTLYYY